MNRVYNMDLEWKFSANEDLRIKAKGHRQVYLSTKAGETGGPASKNYDDSGWRVLDLPHDFVVETDIEEEYENRTPGCHKQGTAWYRKSFILDKEFDGKQVAICFEGIAMQAKIYLNGSLIAHSFSAYTEQFIDITERVYVGGKSNTIAVCVDSGTELAECWTYEGGGIYKHVKLYVKDKLCHIAHNGVFAKPRLFDEKKKLWNVDVFVELENSGYEDGICDVRIKTARNGGVVNEQTTKNVSVRKLSAGNVVKFTYPICDPDLWDVDFPNLYTLNVAVIKDGIVLDEDETDFGFRYYHFDADKGFFLNGRRLKLKGVSCHQDHAGVGVALPDNLQYYRIKLLKGMGVNMYRSAHNNPAKELLTACDRLGVLVIDENRHFECSEENLKHLAITTKRDRNHPCVFLYCLFNEETLQNTEEGRKIYRRMKEEILKYDDSRLFTGAMNGNLSGAAKEMDVCGINYGYGYLDDLHENNPDVCIIGTENNSQLSTRGAIKTDREKEHVIAAEYDEEYIAWGCSVRYNWEFARKRDYMSGVSIWTGFDYRGETVMNWPTVQSSFGLMDICGFYKGVGYYAKSCYSDKPFIKVLPHWNHQKGENVRVVITSNCPETELFLNGRSLGRYANDCCAPHEWTVPFESGRLSGKGYKDGETVEDVVWTASEPKKIVVKATQTVFGNSGGDSIILNCCTVDDNGVFNPVADAKLYFDIEGDATLLGVGNGDQNSHENEKKPEIRLYYGLCQAIFKVNHKAKHIKITVKGEGLEPAVFVPEIAFDAGENYIYSSKNNYITRLEATPSSDKWIDPMMAVDIDDMNTFLPVVLEDDVYQGDYRSGWKLYRAFIRLPHDPNNSSKTRQYTLSFETVRANKMFVFVDGKEIYRKELTHRYLMSPINCEFSGEENGVVELRVLFHVNIENEDGCGLSKYIKLI